MNFLKKITENKVLTIPAVFLALLAILIVVDAYKKKDGAWVVLKTKDFMNGVSYYDQNILKNAVNMNPQVRIKTVYSGEGREFFINFITNFISKGSAVSTLDNFSYVINQDELDCKAKRYKLLSTTLYDKENKVIYSVTYEKPEWKEIPTKSDLEELAQDLCK